MPGPSSRRRQAAVNYWPGFVDALAALLVVVVFLVMVFALAQAFLSDALSGRDDALSKLNRQVNELARMLDLERSANAELRLSISQLSAQLQSSISERDLLAERLSFTAAELDAAKQTSATEIYALQTRIDADQETINAQKRELARLQERIDTDHETISAQQRDLTRLEADIAERESRLAQITERAETAETSLGEQRGISQRALDQVALLNQQLAALRQQLAALNEVLEASRAKNQKQEIQLVNLGKRLNEALATKVQELARYRSEFFGRLREVLGDRRDIRIEGDRFVFQSEVLFSSGQAVLNPEGTAQLEQLAQTLAQIAAEIPDDIEWILRVDGHTDERPISTARFPSNWELASARAISVVKFLVRAGIPADKLVAAGFGEFQPIDTREDEIAYRRNRRIEFKLDQR